MTKATAVMSIGWLIVISNFSVNAPAVAASTAFQLVEQVAAIVIGAFLKVSNFDEHVLFETLAESAAGPTFCGGPGRLRLSCYRSTRWWG